MRKPETYATTPEHAEQSDRWAERRLKLAGAGYIVGDVAGVLANVVKGNSWGSVGGFMTWLAGGIAAADFGNPDAEKRLAILSDKLGQHLRAQGVKIPTDEAGQSALLQQKSFLQRLNLFCYEHPSELLNAAYAVGAGMFLHEGIGQMRAQTHHLKPFSSKPLNDKFWMGVLVMGGALIGLFAKEHDHAQTADEAPKSKGPLAFITEKPLRVSAALYTANNGFLANSAWKDFQAARAGAYPKALKPHYFSLLTLCCYLSSNALLFGSHRDQLAGKTLPPEQWARLTEAAAATLAAQSAPVQEAMLKDASQYLAAQPGVGKTAAEISQALANRLTELTQQRAQGAADSVSWAAREKAKLAQMGMDVSEPARG